MDLETVIIFALVILTAFSSLEIFYSAAKINDRYSLLGLILLYAASFLPGWSFTTYEIDIFSLAAAWVVFFCLMKRESRAGAWLSVILLGLTEALLLSIFPIKFAFVLDTIFMGYMPPLGFIAGLASGLLAPGIRGAFASSILALSLLEPLVWGRMQPITYMLDSWGGNLFAGLMPAFVIGGAIKFLWVSISERKQGALKEG